MAMGFVLLMLLVAHPLFSLLAAGYLALRLNGRRPAGR